MNSRTPRSALLVVNPSSRSAADDAALDSAVERMEEAGIRMVRVESSSAEHAGEEIARHRDSVDLVVLAGGDGTVHSVAAALLEHDMPFAILPMGTANDLARSLAIPIDLEDAVDAIIEGRRVRIDLGSANGHYFFNAVHVGLGVTINHELDTADKKKWGVFSYLKALFGALRRQRTFRAVLKVDGETHRIRSKQVAVGNGRFYGGGNVIDEDASIDEGLLHVYSIAPKSFWELLLLAPFLRSGKPLETSNYFRASGRCVQIESPPGMEVFTDGEPTSTTPLTLEVMPGALEAVAPDGPVSNHAGAARP